MTNLVDTIAAYLDWDDSKKARLSLLLEEDEADIYQVAYAVSADKEVSKVTKMERQTMRAILYQIL